MVKVWKYKIKPCEVITTEVGDIFINEDEILITRYRNNLDFELGKAILAIKICEEISCGNKMLAMINTGEHGSMPAETRVYLSSKEVASHRKAVALVINNLPHRIIANFIIRIRRSYHPTKVFNNEKDALKWLKEFQ